MQLKEAIWTYWNTWQKQLKLTLKIALGYVYEATLLSEDYELVFCIHCQAIQERPPFVQTP